MGQADKVKMGSLAASPADRKADPMASKATLAIANKAGQVISRAGRKTKKVNLKGRGQASSRVPVSSNPKTTVANHPAASNLMNKIAQAAPRAAANPLAAVL